MKNNIVAIIEKLPDLIALKPASEKQISDAEFQLNVCFSDEYKLYLAKFGAIMAEANYRNVVSLTKKERELNPKVSNDMYVIENTKVDGIIIWQDNRGKILETKPNEEPKIIADSLSEYILNMYSEN